MTIDPITLSAFKGENDKKCVVRVEGFNEDGVRQFREIQVTGKDKGINGLEQHAEDLAKLLGILVRCFLEATKWKNGITTDNYTVISLDTYSNTDIEGSYQNITIGEHE